MSEQAIEILNWEKFNERSDVKHSSWFRLEHSIAFDPEWDHFSAEERWVWVWILSLASFKNRRTIYVSTEGISDRTKVSIETVSSALQKLAAMGCIKITSRGRNARGTKSTRGRSPTDGRTDETDGRDETNETLLGPEAPKKVLPVLAQLWNENADPKLPRVRDMSAKSKRRAACEARWVERPDRAYWLQVIGKINASSFCLGQGSTGWRADIDFLCRPDAAEKVLEGKYDNRSGGRPPSPGTRRPMGSFERSGESVDDQINRIMNDDDGGPNAAAQ